MSYFSDDEDDLRNSVSSDDNNSDDDDDDIEPTTSPSKKINKENVDDELIDEDINESEVDENDDDDNSEAMTDTDDETEYDYDEIEEIGKESKKSESEKTKNKKTENKKQNKSKNIKKNIIFEDDDDEDDDDDDEDENYLQKFNESISQNYILNNHPECIVHNYNEVLSLCRVIRDANGIIIDDLHKTLPYLTKYERARTLGVRAKQINSGATPFVKLTEEIIDGYIIAEMELREKKIPFIIKRPMPNGGCEYWFLKDLEDLAF
jgi:DNA-directed RNA polymerase I, II, and III subunit RPABC2